MQNTRHAAAATLVLGLVASTTLAQDPPNQQCLDDAGPPYEDQRNNYDGHPDLPLLDPEGECAGPLREACSRKPARLAYLEGPVQCPAGKGWFCRIAFQDGWSRNIGAPGQRYMVDSNFMYCNVSNRDHTDGDGHCHGSDVDSTYGWWIRDHWNRGYAGTLNCCCGWTDLQDLAIVSNCDYRHPVYANNSDSRYRPGSCRDANEDHGLGFELQQDGAPTGENEYGCYNPDFSDPLDTNPDQCWSILNFGLNEDPPGTPLSPTTPPRTVPPPSAPTPPTTLPPTPPPSAPTPPTNPPTSPPTPPSAPTPPTATPPESACPDGFVESDEKPTWPRVFNDAVDSVDDCAMECEDIEDCTGFTFKKSTSKCVVFTGDDSVECGTTRLCCVPSDDQGCPAGFHFSNRRPNGPIVYRGLEDSFSDCADHCDEDEGCTGFRFHHHDNRCRVYSGEDDRSCGSHWDCCVVD